MTDKKTVFSKLSFKIQNWLCDTYKAQILNILLNMPKLKKIPDQCHSFEEIGSESKDSCSNESSNVGRILRKRKVNLNRLASSVSCPEVCQFQHCGVQLANDDTLEVSYVITDIKNYWGT